VTTPDKLETEDLPEKINEAIELAGEDDSNAAAVAAGRRSLARPAGRD